MPENVTFHARDNTNLKGTYWPGEGPSVILLHQYNKDRHSWDSFAAKLNEKGYSVLSFDFRGFGESDRDKDTFDVNDFLSLVSDVKAAKRLLEEKGADTGRIFIVGASIGANTAMNYAPIDAHVEGLVLLSPGVDYRGIKIEESAKVYQGSMLIVACDNDEYSRDSAKRIDEVADSEDKTVQIIDGSMHGTDMLSDVEGMIIEWISART